MRWCGPPQAEQVERERCCGFFVLFVHLKSYAINPSSREKVLNLVWKHALVPTLLLSHVRKHEYAAFTLLKGSLRVSGDKNCQDFFFCCLFIGTSHGEEEEEVGRQHQRVDRPGVRQVPEGSGEQEKMEKTGCRIICGAPTTFSVKGLMMMTIIDTSFFSWSICGNPLGL